MAQMADEVMHSKFRGCLLGSHVGDCLGCPFEFAPVCPDEIFKFMEVCATVSKATWYRPRIFSEPPKILRYTDDTEMTLSLGKSLAENGKMDVVDISRRFVAEYYKYQDRNYGNHVPKVFYELKVNNFSDVYGPARTQFDGMGSYGNGAAMRISPVPLFSFNLDKQKGYEAVRMSSNITHTHEHGVNGAILQHLAIMEALKTDPSVAIEPVVFVNSLLEEMEAIEQTSANPNLPDLKKPYCKALKDIKDFFETGKYEKITPTEIAKILGNNVIAVRSVPSAIFCFLRGLEPLSISKSENPFMRSIHYVLSLGGDTDTIAAMTGSISGAYYGEDIIPKSIVKKCESIDESIRIADQLYDLYIATKH